ncbi:MAG: HAD family hydrolase [Candidatus Odinarchaeia archaeon]
MVKIKAVIFDLDGVLIPIPRQQINLIKEALISYISLKTKKDKNQITREFNKHYENTFEEDPYLKLRKTAIKFITSIEADAVFRKVDNNTYPEENKILKTVKELKKKKIKIVVVSNRNINRINEILNTTGLKTFIDKVASSYNLFKTDHPQPKYEVYKRILRELNIPPQEICVVGDCYNFDLTPALKLNFKTILIIHGNSPIFKAINREKFEKLITYLS